MSDNFVFTDIETMGTDDSSAIVSLGMIAVDFSKPYTFEELIESGFHTKLDYKEQIKDMGRTVTQDTVDFWKKQSGFAKEILAINKESLPVKKLLPVMNEYLDNCNVHINDFTIWLSRRQFDYVLLKNLFVSLGYVEDDLPWKFWNIRDVVTAVHFSVGDRSGRMGITENNLPGFCPHNALHDVCADVIRMQELFRQVGLIEH